jgi:23S rRNA (uridine2552-2'-O)-methyltransferase
MSRSGKDPRERLKTAKKRTASSARWLSRQINDPYVKQARAEGWRSRAAFKLIELDEKFTLLRGSQRVVDLASRRAGGARWCARRHPPRAWSASTSCPPSRSRA